MRSSAREVGVLCGLLALLLIASFSGVQVVRLSQERARVRRHYSDVNSIENGLLSVEVWMGHLRKMSVRLIDRFALSDPQKKTVRDQLTREMNALLDQVEKLHVEGLKAKLGKAAVGWLPRSEVPALVDAALAEAAKPESRKALEKLTEEKLDDYAAQTRDTNHDRPNVREYYRRYRVDNRRDFNRVTLARAESLRRSVKIYSAVMVGCLLLTVAAWLSLRGRRALQKPLFIVSLLLALVTLCAGLGSPMIEIDARIRRLDFILVGEHLRFDDQVLFYQSKSILQVVWALFTAHQADSMFVGALILLFSVLLPVAKLVCTELVLLGGPRLQRSRLVQIVAFKTGKWSMADVLVVAIFMAYVGFKAILDSQLRDLNVHTASLASVATNETSLQPAFILFTSFVLFGLVLAELIKRRLL